MRSGDLTQDLVSGPATEPVVDLLEPVDVNEQSRHRHVLAARSREDLFGPVEDQTPVGRSVSRSCSAWYASSSVFSVTIPQACLRERASTP